MFTDFSNGLVAAKAEKKLYVNQCVETDTACLDGWLTVHLSITLVLSPT